jgi:hypothetical protein
MIILTGAGQDSNAASQRIPMPVGLAPVVCIEATMLLAVKFPT